LFLSKRYVYFIHFNHKFELITLTRFKILTIKTSMSVIAKSRDFGKTDPYVLAITKHEP
jgi:hypothetical protein